MRRTSLLVVILLTLASVAAPTTAQAGCLDALKSLLKGIGGGALQDAEALFEGIAPTSELTWIDHLGRTRKLEFKSFNAQTGTLVFVDAANREVKASLGVFLSDVKGGTISVDGVAHAVKLGEGIVGKKIFEQMAAALQARGVAIVTGEEAEQALAVFKSGIKAPRAYFDPRTNRLLVAKKANLEEVLGQIRRTEYWVGIPNSDLPLRSLFAALTQAGGGAGAIPAEFEELLRTARELGAAEIAAREAQVADWRRARDLLKERKAAVTAVDVALAKIKPTEVRRTEIAEAVARLKNRAAEADSKLLAKYPIPDLTPGRLAKFDVHNSAVIKPEDLAAVWTLARRYGVDAFVGASYRDLVEQVFLKIKAGGVGLKPANKMAEFGMELDKLLVGVADEGQRAVRFSVAEAVQSLEAFQPTEYVAQPLTKIRNARKNFIHFSEYPEYVKGYIDKTPPFTNINYNGFDVLTFSDIRDGASHNMWPLLIKDHDVRHVHYALGHPRGAGVYFMTARSKNPLRFVMESGLYEGVDRTQYYHESGLAKYLRDSMHMDIEQGMVYLARAPTSELERIGKASGYWTDIQKHADALKGWRPKEAGEFTAAGFSGSPNLDIDQEIKMFDDFKKNPANAKYTNYDRNPPPGGATVDHPELNSAHH